MISLRSYQTDNPWAYLSMLRLTNQPTTLKLNSQWLNVSVQSTFSIIITRDESVVCHSSRASEVITYKMGANHSDNIPLCSFVWWLYIGKLCWISVACKPRDRDRYIDCEYSAPCQREIGDAAADNR